MREDCNNNLKKYETEIKIKSKKTKTLGNLNMLCNGRREAIKFYEDYSSMILEAKAAEEQEGTGLKIITPKQMLERLPIALAEVKAVNNSERLLNEIRQNVYSLYQSKQISKKIYNHIIESIQ